MSLAENLRLAQAAYNHTEAVVHVGADNRPDDMAKAAVELARREAETGTLGKVLPVFFGPAPQLNEELMNKQRDEKIRPAALGEPVPRLKQVIAANIVETSGIGRCGEQSAVAFSYLLEFAEGTPFGVATIIGGNHQFVLIGVEGHKVRGYYPLASAPIWPSDAVILDCWAKLYFPVAPFWPTEIPKILAQTRPGYAKPTVELKPLIFHKNPVRSKFKVNRLYEPR